MDLKKQLMEFEFDAYISPSTEVTKLWSLDRVNKGSNLVVQFSYLFFIYI